MQKLPLILTLAALISAPTLVSAVELSLVRGSLENLGVDTDAAGVVHSTFTRNNPQLQAKLRGLTPGQTYQFTVDAVTQAEFAAGADGRAELRFRLEPQAGQSDLDFDPRGHLLAVNDGTADVLSMVYSGQDEPADIRVDERTTLRPVDETLGGRVDLRYLTQKNQTRFVLHFHGFESGVYTVYVDGQPQADVTFGNGRSKMLTFSVNTRSAAKKPANTPGNGNPKRLELDFDARGLVVDIVKEGAIFYSGEMLAKVAGVNVVEPIEPDVEPATTTVSLPLLNQAADADASGHVTIVSDANGAVSLEVSVSNLPAGAYDFVVDGTVKGTLTVTADYEAATLSFPTTEGAALDFSLAGVTVAVSQGATTFLSRPLP